MHAAVGAFQNSSKAPAMRAVGRALQQRPRCRRLSVPGRRPLLVAGLEGHGHYRERASLIVG
jgi:hypothetical protein